MGLIRLIIFSATIYLLLSTYFTCILNGVVGEPSKVGTTTKYAVDFSFQRKSFYAYGRFWIFYYNGTNMVFRSSIDGTTWSPHIDVKATTSSQTFSIWFDDIYVHYALAPGSTGDGLIYCRGRPSSDGTITWSTSHVAIAGVSGITLSKPFISEDSEGYPWISYNKGDGSIEYPYVTKSSTGDGAWTTASDFPYQLSTASSPNYASTIVPLTRGKTYAVYATIYEVVKGRLWDGVWGSEESASTSKIKNHNAHSVVANGDNVYLLFPKDTSDPVTYDMNAYPDMISVKRTYDSGWGAENTLASVTRNSVPILTINGTTNLIVFWGDLNKPHIINHIYYMKCLLSNDTWESEPTDWVDETKDGLPYQLLTGPQHFEGYYRSYSGVMGVTYLKNDNSPYTIHFIYLPSGIYKTTLQLTVSVEPNKVLVGERVIINGSLSSRVKLSLNISLTGKDILLRFTETSGIVFTQTVRTQSNGSFSTSYETKNPGSWSILARLEGDENLQTTLSNETLLIVEETPLYLNPFLYLGGIAVILAAVFLVKFLMTNKMKSKITSSKIFKKTGFKTYLIQIFDLD